MKLYKYLIALAAPLWAACSQDDGIPTPQYENVDVQANIVYGSMTGGFTRSNPLDESTTFSNNDVIVVTTDGQEPTEYTFNGSSWEPKANNPLKWKQESMTFTAWYPATEGTSATNLTLPETLSENNIAQWDYMTATAENATRENGVKLAFSRKMALVVIDEVTVDGVFGNGVAVSSIKLHTNSCGYENGEVKTGTSQIAMLNVEDKFYAIVSPTTEAATSIFLTITLSNNETAIVKGIPALTAGNKYTYNLNVGREAVATSVSVDEWTSSTDNPLSLEGGLSYTISADGGTYTVYRAHGLMAWNTAVQSNKDLNLTLGDDIDMQGIEGWQQVSDYTGTVTGNGYTVSGLTMNVSGSGNAGFIAKLGVNGKIVNLNLAGLTVNGSATNAGGLVGENSGGTVGACSVTGAVTASSATGSVGGLVGLNSSGLVLSSYSTGAVSGSANAIVGDVVGTNTDSGKLTGCYHSNGLLGVGVGTGNVTIVGEITGMKWIPANDNDNGAMNVMNSKMTDDLKYQLGNGFGWISNSGTDKESRPLIIGSGARFEIKSHVVKTVGTTKTYEVYTAEGLEEWNKSVRSNNKSNLMLMDDIDMIGKSWSVYGESNTSGFSGTIDGNGKSIYNLSISSKANNGFIGHNTGVIKNLHLRNLSVKGTNYVGGIVGRNNGQVVGCSVSGTIAASGYGVGGVVGVMDNQKAKVVACYNIASVSSSITLGPTHGEGNGGVVGRISAYNIEMKACYNLGTVSSKECSNSGAWMRVGFVVGRNNYDGGSNLSWCCWKTPSESVANPATKAIGTGSGTTKEINNDYPWSTALEEMNQAITSSYGCKYVSNGNNTEEPLKLVKTGN